MLSVLASSRASLLLQGFRSTTKFGLADIPCGKGLARDEASRPTTNTSPSINAFDHSNHYTEFFICSRSVQNGAITNWTDGTLMNLNFAFACMIVVSFAIALGHA